MRTMSHPSRAAAILLALGGAYSASAQPAATPPTTRSYVQVLRLKPEMVNEWLELQRNEVIPAQKKAGVANRVTLATAVGNAFEYTILTPFPTWAAMDGDAPLVRALGTEGAAALNAKLRKCIASQSSYLTNRRDDLTIAGDDALVWRIAVRRAIPGKMADYLAYFKAEMLPALQKAKADGKLAGATVAVRGAGAASGEFTVVTQYAKFADLDGPGPIVHALGQQAADAVTAKAALYSTAGQVIIRRRVADLSF